MKQKYKGPNRRYVRYSINKYKKFKAALNSLILHSSHIIDLNSSGVRLKLPAENNPPKIDQEISFRLFKEDELCLNTLGVVRWRRKLNDEQIILGIEFDDYLGKIMNLWGQATWTKFLKPVRYNINTHLSTKNWKSFIIKPLVILVVFISIFIFISNYFL